MSGRGVQRGPSRGLELLTANCVSGGCHYVGEHLEFQVNSSPSLAVDNMADEIVKTKMVEHTLQIVDPPAIDRAVSANPPAIDSCECQSPTHAQ